MSETITRESLGASIKRTFIAFLISSFMAPVGVWLGIEYVRLSSRFETAGQGTQNLPLSRAAKFFKVMAIFCFISAGMYVVNMAVIYPVLYSPLMYFMEHPSDPAMLLTVVSALGVVITFVIVSMAITIASSRITRLAWEQVFENLEGEPSPMERTSGSFQIARVIKGATQAFQAGVMLAIVMVLFGVLILLRFSMTFMIFLVIPMIIFGIIGGISALAGMVNQAVGLFDLGRNMGNDASIEHRILFSGIAGSNEPAAKIKAKICPRCNETLPDDPSVKYCPSCGNPI